MRQVVTVIVPEPLLEAAGHLCLIIGTIPQIPEQPWRASMQHTDGTKCLVLSGQWEAAQINGLLAGPAALELPQVKDLYGPAEQALADRALCQTAAEARVLWDIASDPMPATDKIIAVIGPPGQEVIEAADLTPVGP